MLQWIQQSADLHACALRSLCIFICYSSLTLSNNRSFIFSSVSSESHIVNLCNTEMWRLILLHINSSWGMRKDFFCFTQTGKKKKKGGEEWREEKWRGNIKELLKGEGKKKKVLILLFFLYLLQSDSLTWFWNQGSWKCCAHLEATTQGQMDL